MQRSNGIQRGPKVMPTVAADPAQAADAPVQTLEIPTPPTAKPPRRSRFTLRGGVPGLVGRIAKGSVMAVMIGSMLTMPGSTPQPGAPVEVVAEQPPQGTEVAKLSEALGQIGGAFAPGLTREQALRQLRYATFSVALDQGLTPGPNGEGLSAPPGTRLEVTLTRYGFTVNATPGVEWRKNWVPDPEVHSIRYSFQTGAFTSEAEGLGYDSWYESSINSLVDQHLRPRMPSAMREPGYDPFSDPHLEDRLQQVVDLFSGTASETSREGSVSAPHVSFGFSIPEEVTLPLAGSESVATIQAGTRVDFSGRLEGGFSSMRLGSLEVRFSEPVGITKAGEADAVLARMDLTSFHLAPGGQVSLQYRLGPEDAVDGVRALGLLLAVLAEPRLATRGDIHFSSTQMDGLRANVQERIDGELEPRLIDVIREHDEAIPGLSLMRLFGIDATPDVAPRG